MSKEEAYLRKLERQKIKRRWKRIASEFKNTMRYMYYYIGNAIGYRWVNGDQCMGCVYVNDDGKAHGWAVHGNYRITNNNLNDLLNIACIDYVTINHRLPAQ